MHTKEYYIRKNVILAVGGVIFAIALSTALTLSLGLRYLTISLVAIGMTCNNGIFIYCFIKRLAKHEKEINAAHPDRREEQIVDALSQFRITAAKDLSMEVGRALSITGIVMIFSNLYIRLPVWTGVGLLILGAGLENTGFYYRFVKSRNRDERDS